MKMAGKLTGLICRRLRHEQPDWTRSQLATALSRSVAWVKKWLKRLEAGSDHDPDRCYYPGHVALKHPRPHYIH